MNMSDAPPTFNQTTVAEAADVLGMEDHSALLESGLELIGSNVNTTIQSNTTSPHDSAVLKTTFQVYGTALVVILILFCWARLQFPLAFSPRKARKSTPTTETKTTEGSSGYYHHLIPDVPKDLHSSLADEQYGFLSWSWKIFKISDEDIMDHCGLDALCCIRLCALGWKLSVLGILNAVWLMPVYSTADNNTDKDMIQDAVGDLTTGNIPDDSSRLIATAVATYIVFLHAMYAILKEFKWFTKMRHRFLQKTEARNYAVFVRNIPEGYRGNQGLKRFFEKSLRGVRVLETCVCVKLASLKSKVSERNKIIVKLEHAVAVADETGRRPTHTENRNILQNAFSPNDSVEVDSIKYYVGVLKEMNKEISDRIHILQNKINQQPDDVGDLHSDLDSFEADRDPEEKSNDLLECINDNTTGMLQKTVTEQAQMAGEAAGIVAGMAAGAINLILPGDDGEIHSSGFVVFSTLSNTQAALQMIHNEIPYSMEVFPAPDPDEILWGNIGREHHDLQMGLLLSACASAALCLFWTIPVAFVSSLSNLDSLRNELPSLDNLLEAAPFLTPLFELLAPQLLVLLNSALPFLLSFCSSLEGYISRSVKESSTFVKLAWFVIIQTFFVSTLSGALLQEIQRLISQPKSIIDLLAQSLPAQSTFFTQMSFVTTVSAWLSEGLGLSRIGGGLLRRKIGPRVTARDREKVLWGFLRPLSNPKDFKYGKSMSSKLILLFMVYLVYSAIAPLVSFVTALCFALLEVLCRHQFIYVYRPKPDSGGMLFLEFIKILTICLLIAEVTVFGLMALKKSVVSTFLIPLVIGTTLFSVHLRRQHFSVAQFLPTMLCLHKDKKMKEMDFSFVKNVYLHPAMQEANALPNLSQEWLEELGFCSMVEENEISQEGMAPNDYHTTVANNGITCRIKKLEIPSGVILLDDASTTQ